MGGKEEGFMAGEGGGIVERNFIGGLVLWFSNFITKTSVHSRSGQSFHKLINHILF